jgi:hypothetical protein
MAVIHHLVGLWNSPWFGSYAFALKVEDVNRDWKWEGLCVEWVEYHDLIDVF